ncbi:MAG: hypothetical protein ABIK89_10000 [Planctomycetota bacterium]
MGIIKAIYFLIRAFLVLRLSLAAENLALRQQVAVYEQSVKRPKLRPRDRVFWVLLSRLWPNWRSALAIVQPETVISPWIATRRHHAASNRRSGAKSLPSRKSAACTIDTRGAPRDRRAQFPV